MGRRRCVRLPKSTHECAQCGRCRQSAAGRCEVVPDEEVTRIIRVIPLPGSPGCQPLTCGMQAALPHVDIFHPVHNLASLEALVRHLAP